MNFSFLGERVFFSSAIGIKKKKKEKFNKRVNESLAKLKAVESKVLKLQMREEGGEEVIRIKRLSRKEKINARGSLKIV